MPRATASEMRDGEPEAESGTAELTGRLREHDHQDAHRSGHGAGGEVELPTDHEERDGDGHDAERRRVVDQVGCTVGGAERDRDGPEEDPDADDTDERADLGSNEQSLENAAVGEPLVAALRHGTGRCCDGRISHRAEIPQNQVRAMDVCGGCRPSRAGTHRTRWSVRSPTGDDQRVPAATRALTSAAFSGVTKPGPVRIGMPPPAVFWFVTFKYRSRIGRYPWRYCC